MNVWKSLPEYPLEEDIIYELSAYLAKDKRPNGKFTEQTFNSVFGSNWRETKYKDIIERMLSNGIFAESEDSKPSRKRYFIKEKPIYNN